MLNLKVITPEAICYDGDVEMVVAPGSCGEFGVLEDHCAFVSLLHTGVLRITNLQGNIDHIAITEGVLETKEKNCVVLAEFALSADSRSANELQERVALLVEQYGSDAEHPELQLTKLLLNELR